MDFKELEYFSTIVKCGNLTMQRGSSMSANLHFLNFCKSWKKTLDWFCFNVGAAD